LLNLLLLGTMALIVVPLFALVLGLSTPKPLLLAGVLVIGCLGLGSAATIVAAITSKARGKGALFGALGFPVLIPQLIVAVNATRLCLSEPVQAGEVGTMLVGLAAFGVMIVTVSALVFPFVWEE
jgi:heme exporter protein B